MAESYGELLACGFNAEINVLQYIDRLRDEEYRDKAFSEWDTLETELKRIGQEKLEEPEDVAANIINLILDKNVKTGEIRRV